MFISSFPRHPPWQRCLITVGGVQKTVIRVPHSGAYGEYEWEQVSAICTCLKRPATRCTGPADDPSFEWGLRGAGEGVRGAFGLPVLVGICSFIGPISFACMHSGVNRNFSSMCWAIWGGVNLDAASLIWCVTTEILKPEDSFCLVYSTFTSRSTSELSLTIDRLARSSQLRIL